VVPGIAQALRLLSFAVEQSVSQDNDSRMTGTADVRPKTVTSTELQELARLRDELALIRRELAWLQSSVQVREERLAELVAVERERDKLAAILARHLSRPPLPPGPAQIGGRRGWLIRRLMPDVTLAIDPMIELIEGCKLFDAAWYLRTYPDVAEGGEWPALHYLHHGGSEGRWAGPRFDSGFYLARYPDVRDSGVNPLVHYLQRGREEGRITMQPVWQPSGAAADAGA